ncbi:type II toxin-antitoxin system RelE/ParE family toxin [Rhizobium leguminosarum]|nr:type II toxin-antitoxin system RelE/ParE family toxin [Rhizobium leguminosarum]
MPASLVWLPQALADVREIYVQIGLEQPQAAERFFDSFERKARLLTDQPKICAKRPLSTPYLKTPPNGSRISREQISRSCLVGPRCGCAMPPSRWKMMWGSLERPGRRLRHDA